MAIRALFPTFYLQAPVNDARAGGVRFRQALADECRALAASDPAGRRWSQRHYHGGYTSYGSHDRLHLISPLFDRLRRLIDRHVASFARALHYDLRGRELAMTDCWVNLMPAGVAHSLHLHPGAFISGTYYVEVPRGAGALKFEDPRLGLHMAAPPREPEAPRPLQAFVSVPARAGEVVLFESWLRHEVPAARFSGERISISFNYGWSLRPVRRRKG